MPSVQPPKHSKARPRDYFDISTIHARGFDLRKTAELLPKVFEAKHVALEHLCEIPNTRAMHSTDWGAVRAAAGPAAGEFNEHADVVEALVSQLRQMLGHV